MKKAKDNRKHQKSQRKRAGGGGGLFVEIVLKGLLSERKMRGEIIHPSPIPEKQKRSENGGR